MQDTLKVFNEDQDAVVFHSLILLSSLQNFWLETASLEVCISACILFANTDKDIAFTQDKSSTGCSQAVPCKRVVDEVRDASKDVVLVDVAPTVLLTLWSCMAIHSMRPSRMDQRLPDILLASQVGAV